MVYYRPVKVTINAPRLAEVIIDMVIKYHDLLNSIIGNQGAIFTFKFWFSFCYFFNIKQYLFTMFHPQTNGQTKRQKSTIEVYLCVFVKWEQNDWARRLLLMVEFAYDNSKNASTGHMPFELNCGYHLRILYKNEIDSHF